MPSAKPSIGYRAPLGTERSRSEPAASPQAIHWDSARKRFDLGRRRPGRIAGVAAVLAALGVNLLFVMGNTLKDASPIGTMLVLSFLLAAAILTVPNPYAPEVSVSSSSTLRGPRRRLAIIPLLTVLMGMPAYLPLGALPGWRVALGLGCALGASYLIYRIVYGVTLARRRWDAVRPEWRPADRVRIEAMVADLSEAFGPNWFDRIELRHPNDRDAHAIMVSAEWTVRLFRSTLVLTHHAREMGSHARRALREELPATTHAFHEGYREFGVRVPKGQPVREVTARVQRLVEAFDCDGGVAQIVWLDELPPRTKGTVQATAYDEAGGRVEWRLDRHTLCVRAEGCSDLVFDLERPFRVLVSLSPASAMPWLQLGVRQQGTEDLQESEAELASGLQSRVGATWLEAKVALPLKTRSDGLSSLPVEQSDAPVLNEPEMFPEIWSFLYLACSTQGGAPPRLPALDIAQRKRRAPAESKFQTHPVDRLKFWGQPNSQAPRVIISALLGCALIVGFAISTFVFPVLKSDDPINGHYLPVMMISALLALSCWRFIWGGSVGLTRYSGVLTAELAAIHEALATEPSTIKLTASGIRGNVRSFARMGLPFSVSMSDERGLSSILSVWPAGYGAFGLVGRERLELRVKRSQHPVQAKQLMKVVKALEANAWPFEMDDTGADLLVMVETRRLLGHRQTSWHALVAVIADMLTPGRIPSMVPRSLPEFCEVIPAFDEDTSREVYGRPVRGLRHGFAVALLFCLPASLPWVFASDYPRSVPGPPQYIEHAEPALAHRCPLGEGEMLTDLREYQCLANSAGITWPVNAQHGYDLVEVLIPRTLYGGLSHSDSDGNWVYPTYDSVSCEFWEEWLEGERPQIGYAEEIQRRFEKRTPSYLSRSSRFDTPVLLDGPYRALPDLALRCGESQLARRLKEVYEGYFELSDRL